MKLDAFRVSAALVAALRNFILFADHESTCAYFFFLFKKALAAAKRAMGTRNGEQLT